MVVFNYTLSIYVECEYCHFSTKNEKFEFNLIEDLGFNLIEIIYRNWVSCKSTCRCRLDMISFLICNLLVLVYECGVLVYIKYLTEFFFWLNSFTAFSCRGNFPGFICLLFFPFLFPFRNSWYAKG